MSASAPSLSVVIPVYNGERFVAEALDSIAAQTHRDFEAIVIDDGSTDRSLEHIRRCVAGDPRFRIVTRENRGLVASCNEGIALARSRYVFRMDADDVSHRDRLALQMGYLEREPGCVAVGTRMQLADEDLWPIVEMVGSFTHEEIDAENLRGLGSAMCHPSVAMRRDALLAVGGYRAEFEWAEDLDLFLRLAEIGRLANLREVLLTYRQHAQSVGHRKRALQAERTADAVWAARQRRRDCTELEPAERPRPPPTYDSVASIHRKWAWLALGAGHVATARKHAALAFRMQPWSLSNARLAACVVRGH